MIDTVVEASGPTHAAVKAVMKFRPGFLGREIRVRTSGQTAGDAREVVFETADVFQKAATSRWYNPAPDGTGFVYAGAPARI